jgi:hypothetical protein
LSQFRPIVVEAGVTCQPVEQRRHIGYVIQQVGLFRTDDRQNVAVPQLGLAQRALANGSRCCRWSVSSQPVPRPLSRRLSD